MTAIKLTLQIIWVLSLLAIPASSVRVSDPVPMITLITPAEGSTVVSPIEISAEMNLGDASLLRVTLTNGQNDNISRQLQRVSALGNETFTYTGSLPYEIPNEHAPARLSLMLIDSLNRPLCLRSVTLTLESNGSAAFQNLTSPSPWLVITSPEPGAVISGGEVLVTGQVTPLTGNPVFIDLYSDSGRILITRQIAVDQPGTEVDFSITIPYTVAAEQADALLVISQSASLFSEKIILDSLSLSISL